MTEKRIPSHYRLQFSAQDIQTQIDRLGQELGHWLAESEPELDQQVLTIPIMRGALFFFADLMRSVPFSVEIAPIRAQAYDAANNQLSDAPVQFRLEDIDVAGRHVLLVDDICDSGTTLEALTKTLKVLGVKEVCSTVLIRREIPDSIFTPDHVGINYVGDEWFVGYGMDDAGRWRNLPDIYVIDNSK